METLEVSALEGPTLAVAEGLSMTSLFEHSVAEPTEYRCLIMTDCDDLSKSYSTGLMSHCLGLDLNGLLTRRNF